MEFSGEVKIHDETFIQNGNERAKMTIDERVALLEEEVKALSEQITLLTRHAVKLADSTSKLIDSSKMIKQCVEKHLEMHLKTFEIKVIP